MTVAEERAAGDRQGRSALAARLRELRTRSWPELRVTQSHVAEALGLSVPLVSSWESSTGTAIPTEDRLRAYACFFATRRSLDGGHGRLLEVRELTESEEQVRRHLVDELVRLRERAAQGTGDRPRTTGALGGQFYYYPDGQQIRIIGGSLADYELVRVPPQPGELRHAVTVLRALLLDEGSWGSDEVGLSSDLRDELRGALAELEHYEAVHEALVHVDSVLSGLGLRSPVLLSGLGEERRVLRRALATFTSVGVQYANPWHPNAIASLWHADMDAAVELVGHVRAENPGSDVRWLRVEEVTPDDLTGHLIILGAGDEFRRDKPPSTLGYLPQRLELPVWISLPEGGDEEYDMQFEVLVDDEGLLSRDGTKRETHAPRFQMDGETRLLVHGQPQLVYDVALLARRANPLNTSATVTFCTGIFSRGTYGAVRALTDERLRSRNQQFLSDHLDLSDLALLLHVPVFPGADGAQTVTPDLARPFIRIRSSA